MTTENDVTEAVFRLSNKVGEIMTGELTTAPASSTIQEVMQKRVVGDVDAVMLNEKDWSVEHA
jgi:CBS domain-containing protein